KLDGVASESTLYIRPMPGRQIGCLARVDLTDSSTRSSKGANIYASGVVQQNIGELRMRLNHSRYLTPIDRNHGHLNTAGYST
ncbi:MAG TPA: hypothetical protein PLD10_23760, partial [Rhodopila sp.]|nr:hypothetical protein [Rhodopila sp.]